MGWNRMRMDRIGVDRIGAGNIICMALFNIMKITYLFSVTAYMLHIQHFFLLLSLHLPLLTSFNTTSLLLSTFLLHHHFSYVLLLPPFFLSSFAFALTHLSFVPSFYFLFLFHLFFLLLPLGREVVGNRHSC